MSTQKVISAWKSRAYRERLSAAERAAMPAHPAGSVEIAEEDLGKVAAGAAPMSRMCTMTACTCVYNCTTIICTSDC